MHARIPTEHAFKQAAQRRGCRLGTHLTKVFSLEQHSMIMVHSSISWPSGMPCIFQANWATNQLTDAILVNISNHGAWLHLMALGDALHFQAIWVTNQLTDATLVNISNHGA